MILFSPQQLWLQCCLDKQRTQALPAALLGRWPLALPGWVDFEPLLLSSKECRDFYVASGLRTCSHSAFLKLGCYISTGKPQILRPDCNKERTFQMESPNHQGTNSLGNSKQGEETWSPVGKPVRQTLGGSLSGYPSQAHSESRVLLPVILANQNQSGSFRFWASLLLVVTAPPELQGILFLSSTLILTFLFMQPIPQSRTLWPLM